MKTASLITALLEEKGYKVEDYKNGRKFSGWQINDHFFLWLVEDNVCLVHKQSLTEKPSEVLCQGNLCVTNLHHPKSIDIIESWLDNLESLTIK